MVKRILAMALMLCILLGTSICRAEASSQGETPSERPFLFGDSEDAGALEKLLYRLYEMTGEGGEDNPVIIAVGVGAMAIIVGLIVVIYKLLKKYAGMLRREYHFLLLNRLGLAIVILSAVYSAVDYLFPQATIGWSFLTLTGASEAMQKSGGSLIINTLALLSPLLLIYCIRAFLKMKNILHAVLATVLLMGVTVIGGFLGAFVTFVVVALIVFWGLFALVRESATPVSYRCSNCGKVVSQSEVHSHHC